MVRLKAANPTLICSIISVFQFLMVRLKGFYPLFYLHFCGISIPYGAIKSLIDEQKEINKKLISIPYGAIKSTALNSYRTTQTNFNSLWCD